MNLFIDLDGTLINSNKRLFKLFNELVPESKLSQEQYWKLKRNGETHYSILKNIFNYSDDKIDLFEENWMPLIEADRLLINDEIIFGVAEYLEKIKKQGVNLYLVTARQKKDKVIQQLKSLKIEHLFIEILVTQNLTTKENLIKPYINSNIDNWIIGDTSYDITTGKKLKIKTIAVLSGFQNKKMLIKHKPDLILERITNFNIPSHKND